MLVVFSDKFLFGFPFGKYTIVLIFESERPIKENA